jgi:hypothetical protein
MSRQRQPFDRLTKKPQPALQSLGSDGVEVVVSFWSFIVTNDVFGTSPIYDEVVLKEGSGDTQKLS